MKDSRTKNLETKLLLLLFIIIAFFVSKAAAQEPDLVSTGAEWSYLDYDVNQSCPNQDNTNWKAAGFNDSDWPSGNAELGYGETGQNTTLSFGTDPDNKCITYYFRHHFSVTDASLLSALTLGLVRDDGAVVYLNGHEVVRSNMPPGEITHATLAPFQAHDSRYIDSERDPVYYSIPASTLVEGDNIIAVEVHQVGQKSSDISFDLNLVGTKNGIDNAQEEVVNFAVIGDFGRADCVWEGAVADLVKAHQPEPDFIVAAGDNNLGRGLADNIIACDDQNTTIDENIGQYYQAYIRNYQGSFGAGSTYNRFFPALGNHDWDPVRYGGNAIDTYGVGDDVETPIVCRQIAAGLFPTPHLDYFTLPGNELYYVFRWGPIEFFVVDTDYIQPDNSPDPTINPKVHGADNLRKETSPQALWLKAALAASQAPWKFVVLHHSPYSTGLHGDDDGIENTRWPFEDWGADALIASHDHLYERLQWGGIPLFVNGLGGNPHTYDCGVVPLPLGDITSEVCFDKNIHPEPFGAMFVEVDTASASFEFRSIDNVQQDFYIISKGTEPMIVDNADLGFTTQGSWPTSSFTPGYYGSNYQYSPPGSGSKTATWSFNVSEGEYEISVWWVSSPIYASNAEYHIYNNGIYLGTIPVDQRFGGCQFNVLDTFILDAGSLDVVLTDAADGYVIADAVKVVYLSTGNHAPDGVIDTPASDVTILVGESVSFTGTGSDPDPDDTLTYLWNFGSGSGIPDSTVEDPGPVQFNNEGIFTVTFTVTDNHGVSDSTPATVTITVQPNGDTWIVDNTDPDFSTSGTWPTSSFIPCYYGTNYQYSPPGSGSKTATWSFNVSEGEYEISVWWVPFYIYATNAEYHIYNNGIYLGTIPVDQRFGGCQFNVLDTFILDAGSLDVVLTDAADGYVIADAVKVVYLSTGNHAPDGVIDTPASDVTILVGESVSFTGTGSDPDPDDTLTYLWNFGSGSGIPDSTVEDPGPVQFNNEGIFTVTFTVTDNHGVSDSTPATVTITVQPNGDTWIVDNTDPDFSTSGTWPTSSFIPCYYGTNYQYSPPGSGSKTATWSFNVSEGEYEISVWWVPFYIYATNAEYHIYNNGIYLGTIPVDQRFGGCQFNVLDTFILDAGSLDVVLTDAADGYVIADAVKVVYLSTGNHAPDGVIDTPASDVTILVGESVSFTGTGSDPDPDDTLTYLWNFGSGSGIPDSTVEDPGPVQFNNEGIFTVTFTVTDNHGVSDSTPATVTIIVQPSGGAWIVDNTDPGFSTSGTWPTSSFTPGYYGSNYQYSPPGSGSKTATWSFNVSEGEYEISAQWSSFKNRASNAGYTIYNNGLELGAVYRDQRSGGGQFNALGTFDLDSGTLDLVLTDDADGVIVADAAKVGLSQ